MNGISKQNARTICQILDRVRGSGTEWYIVNQPLYYPKDFVGPPAPVSPYAAIGAARYHFEHLAGLAQH